MEADEELFTDIQSLLDRYSKANVTVVKALQSLRATQAKGKGLLRPDENTSIQSWSCAQATQVVETTRQLAKNYQQVGFALGIQSAIVEELNEKIALIKEKLGHGKDDR